MADHTRHVALVGLMGSGKSSVGALVAHRMKRHFVDIDAEIEAEFDKPVAMIFAERGEAAFREIETETLERILPGRVPLVVATGGGAVLAEENRALLDAHALTVWLDAAPDVLAERLVEGAASRPVLEGAADVGAIAERLAVIADERRDAYAAVARAPHGCVVDAAGDADEVADAVVAGVAGLEADDGPAAGGG